jgi:hypothetical protein
LGRPAVLRWGYWGWLGLSVAALHSCSRDVRGGAPTNRSIAAAESLNEFQRHAPDTSAGARTPAGCGALGAPERCVELALNVALDAETISSRALRVFVTTESGSPIAAVPYELVFVGAPRGTDQGGVTYFSARAERKTVSK